MVILFNWYTLGQDALAIMMPFIQLYTVTVTYTKYFIKMK